MKIVNFILHPGFIRTGSGSFQKIIKSLNFNSIGKPTLNKVEEPWFELFIKNNNPGCEKDFSKSYFYLIDSFKEQLIKKIKKKKYIIYSDESFLAYNNHGFSNIFLIKYILKNIEKDLNIKFNLKIIFTIRELNKFYESVYYHREHLTYKNYEDFLNQI